MVHLSFSILMTTVMRSPAPRKAMVSFVLSKDAKVNVTLLDAAGRVVENLANGSYRAGEHTLRISANPGVYFVKLDAEGKTELQKLVILR